MNKNTGAYEERQKAAKARYIAEKTDCIRAYLPKGYTEKVNKIAEKAGTSKAQAIKNAIDMLYSALFEDAE